MPPELTLCTNEGVPFDFDESAGVASEQADGAAASDQQAGQVGADDAASSLVTTRWESASGPGCGDDGHAAPSLDCCWTLVVP